VHFAENFDDADWGEEHVEMSDSWALRAFVGVYNTFRSKARFGKGGPGRTNPLRIFPLRGGTRVGEPFRAFFFKLATHKRRVVIGFGCYCCTRSGGGFAAIV